ncbi:hypothetical protein PHMEG_00013997 [Phytophthora megakarya]|uniref:Eukaryotic/viral aspartic protease n=1 Tax=Phytophthora megakarya TaxID=4795 RepID=A0A225W513_9STRA|nr:hypothetical protein PHMEG_00013997 [Phytophthora megakarya]
MCLAVLLHHFAEGTPIPEGWLTNINVVTSDDPSCECPGYARPSSRTDNGNSPSGSQGPRRPAVPNLSPPARNKRASTSGSRTGNQKRKVSAARDAPVSKRPALVPPRGSGREVDRQLRPRGYSPRNMLVYSPGNVPDARDLAEAGRALPVGMLWTNLPEDVQHLLLSGMDFKCAMKWVSESQGIHHLAHWESICRILAQVVHAGQLDETPWCRFVPERFYTSAEGTLRLRQAKREPTPPWHPLGRCFIKVQNRKQSTREAEALQAKLPESSDDEVQDPSYELSQAELVKSARAEAAADNDESSEESDESEQESKPATTSPASPQESKTGSKNNKGSKPKSHGASAESKYRVITSSKSQVVPKYGGTPRERKIPALSVAIFLRRARVEVSSEGHRRIWSKLAKLAYD